MSERDAFGREKGEDALAGMGWSSSASPTPASTPNPVPVTPAAATPTPLPFTPQPTMTAGEPLSGATASSGSGGASPGWTPGPAASYTRRRRRRVGGFIIPLFIIAVIAIGIGGATIAFQAGSSALDTFSSSIEKATNPPATTTTRTTPGTDGTSLLQSKALKAALADLPQGKIELLRLAPDRINANVIVKGKLHAVQVTAGGDVSDVSTPAPATGDTIKVNSVAPSRIVRTALKRSGRDAASIDYLVLIHILGKDEWQLYFKDGAHYSASANGKTVHRVG